MMRAVAALRGRRRTIANVQSNLATMPTCKPATANRRVRFKILVGDFDFMQSHKETSVAVGLDFWLSRDDSGYARRTRLCSGDLGELICWCVDDSRAVEREKCCADQRKNERRKTPAQSCQST